MNFTETLQRAKPGSMIDVRSPDNQIDSFRVEDVLAVMDEPCGCVTASDILNSYPVPDNFPSPISR